MPASVAALLTTVPAVLIGPAASTAPLGPRSVAIDTGLAGVHEAGTALRLDDVPLPVREVVAGPPPTAAIVKAVREALAS